MNWKGIKMGLTDVVILVISMWGKTVSGDWVYMGNQYVNQTPMTLTECSELIDPTNWNKFEENEYYKIQLACYHAGSKNGQTS
mgnify:CR=1 FL=1